MPPGVSAVMICLVAPSTLGLDPWSFCPGSGSHLPCLIGVLVTLALLEYSETLLMPRLYVAVFLVTSHLIESSQNQSAWPCYPGHLAHVVPLW